MPILAGTSLAARIRRLTFAIFGLAAVCGLALVAFVAQTGYPVLSVPPLPLPGPALNAPAGDVAGGGTGDSGFLGVGFGTGEEGSDSGSHRGTQAAPTAGEDGVLTAFGSDGSTQPGLAAAPGKSGLGDVNNPEVTSVTPAQQPTTPPESALASVPVEGSSASSALFVRTSVSPAQDESGNLGNGAPLPEEPEVPYEPEPEPPVEPQPPVEPEAPAEPAPEPPAEVEPPAEPPAEEAPAEEAPAEEPAPEAPAG